MVKKEMEKLEEENLKGTGGGLEARQKMAIAGKHNQFHLLRLQRGNATAERNSFHFHHYIRPWELKFFSTDYLCFPKKKKIKLSSWNFMNSRLHEAKAAFFRGSFYFMYFTIVITYF